MWNEVSIIYLSDLILVLLFFTQILIWKIFTKVKQHADRFIVSVCFKDPVILRSLTVVYNSYLGYACLSLCIWTYITYHLQHRGLFQLINSGGDEINTLRKPKLIPRENNATYAYLVWCGVFHTNGLNV